MAKKIKSAGLTRDQILSMDDAPVEVIIKGFGTVFVKQVNSSDRLKLDQLLEQARGDEAKDRQLFEQIIALGICDEEGTLLFSEKDIPKLAEKSFRLIQALVLAVAKVNAINNEAVEIAKGN